jgi:hypothetical protein
MLLESFIYSKNLNLPQNIVLYFLLYKNIPYIHQAPFGSSWTSWNLPIYPYVLDQISWNKDFTQVYWGVTIGDTPEKSECGGKNEFTTEVSCDPTLCSGAGMNF